MPGSPEDHQDVIYGDQGDDFIYAGFGNDTIYGLYGSDWIEGGWQSDVIYAGINESGSIGHNSVSGHTTYGDTSLAAAAQNPPGELESHRISSMVIQDRIKSSPVRGRTRSIVSRATT